MLLSFSAENYCFRPLFAIRRHEKLHQIIRSGTGMEKAEKKTAEMKTEAGPKTESDMKTETETGTGIEKEG